MQCLSSGDSSVISPHCRRNLASAFRTHIINSPKETEALALQSPVRVMGSCSFMYMRHNDVYLLAVTKNNANVMLAFQFMTQVRTLSPKPCRWAVGWQGACRGASACSLPHPGLQPSPRGSCDCCACWWTQLRHS